MQYYTGGRHKFKCSTLTNKLTDLAQELKPLKLLERVALIELTILAGNQADILNG